MYEPQFMIRSNSKPMVSGVLSDILKITMLGGCFNPFYDYNQETKTRQSVEIQREWLDVDRLNAMPGRPVFVDPKNGQ